MASMGCKKARIDRENLILIVKTAGKTGRGGGRGETYLFSLFDDMANTFMALCVYLKPGNPTYVPAWRGGGARRRE